MLGGDDERPEFMELVAIDSIITETTDRFEKNGQLKAIPGSV